MNIICGICKKPVERATVWRNESRQAYEIFVECHGATDSMQLPDKFIVENPEIVDAEGVAFVGKRLEIRKHENCGCAQCATTRMDFPRLTQFIVCEICGNKRCPHATDHNHACTGSNDSGQHGSVYGDHTLVEPPGFREAAEEHMLKLFKTPKK